MLTTSWNRLEKNFRVKFIWSVLKQWMMSMSEVINQWNEPANQAHTPIISITLEHFVSEILLGFHGTFSKICKLMFWYRGVLIRTFFSRGLSTKMQNNKGPKHTHAHTHTMQTFFSRVTSLSNNATLYIHLPSRDEDTFGNHPPEKKVLIWFSMWSCKLWSWGPTSAIISPVGPN